jgi:hypothetical protein
MAADDIWGKGFSHGDDDIPDLPSPYKYDSEQGDPE